MNFRVAILAGGLATRLHPITLDSPKSLVRINGEPFIKWQLELLASRGVTSVVLCLGHKAQDIIEFVGDGHQFGLEVEYSIEHKRLGTGGALKRAEQMLGEPFGVLYGDSYLPINYVDVFEKFRDTKKPALLTYYENNNEFESSNVLIRSDGSLCYSKGKNIQGMRHVDFGFSVLSLDALRAIPTDSTSDLSETFEELSKSGKMAGFEVFERFYEIGSFGGIVELENYLRRKTV